MVAKTFQISTAIDYPSGPPHAGHMYEKVCTDVIARFHRLKGEKVHFSTGLDCHGSKIENYAKAAGKTPEQFVKEMEKPFLELCKLYDISYDDFIKTSEERHKKVVLLMVKELIKKGDIYKGKYKGFYCSECETYWTEKELLDGKCPTHNKPAEILTEDSYFFKMSKYHQKLVDYIITHPDFIIPEKKRNEILSRLEEPLKDQSISRLKVKWGIKFPDDKDFVVAIWTEALINYLSTVDYPNKTFKEFWPALHSIGSDIVWHHTVIWGSWLMALGVPLPKVLVHGFIRDEKGEKMSKSLGNVVDPMALAKKYPTDAIRYYLTREFVFGDDCDFSEEVLKTRLNNELANDLGNLLNRSMTLLEKQFDGKIPKGKNLLKFSTKEYEKEMDEYRLHMALNEAWKLVNDVNRFVNEKEPWKNKSPDVIYTMFDSLRIISILISPFIPKTSDNLNRQLNVKAGLLKDCKPNLLKANTKVGKKELLFKKID